ncbi:MAG: hypothetical protein AB1805_07600 [Nitrospirota bacterium]
MEERKSGSFIVDDDGAHAPNLSDEAMAQAKKLKDDLLRRYAAGKKQLGEEPDSTIENRALIELQIEVEMLETRITHDEKEEARRPSRAVRNESKKEVKSEQQ